MKQTHPVMKSRRREVVILTSKQPVIDVDKSKSSKPIPTGTDVHMESIVELKDKVKYLRRGGQTFTCNVKHTETVRRLLRNKKKQRGGIFYYKTKKSGNFLLVECTGI